MKDRSRTNLAAPTSSFVGRAAELEVLERLFDHARVVTLRGPGGIGKTRLALFYAASRVEAYASAGGVWFVDLTSCRTEADMLAALAVPLEAHNMGLDTEDALSGAVAHAIARLGPALLVLDNLEVVAREAANRVESWARSAPAARFLLTSRVELGIDGEQLLPLGPMERNDAVELFLGRARQVRPDVEVAPPSVAGDIVDAIDRMPLAIELAASRTRLLSASDLLARLDHPLSVLRGARPEERHGCMRRTILDSLALLSGSQRRLFAAASVLRNGFGIDDLEAVVGGISVPRPDVLDEADALVRTSLLRAMHEPGGKTRYAYFETIRDVAEELAEGDPDRPALLAAHARHYAAVAAGGPHHPADLENALLAHQTALTRAVELQSDADGRRAEQVALGLEARLAAQGRSRLRADLFTRTLASSHARDAEAEIRMHLGRGRALRELGETPAAQADFSQALALAQEHALDGLAAVALVRLGELFDITSDTLAARQRFVDALALLERTPDDATRTAREAEARLHLGHAHRREGDLERAAEEITLAIDLHRRLEDDVGLAAALYERAVIEMFVGHADAALAVLDEGLEVARRADARVMLGALTTAQGSVLQERGDLVEATAHHAQAARIFAELGAGHREASALFYLATTYLERCETSEALRLLRQARHRIAAVGTPRYEALIAAVAATVHAIAEQHADAQAELERAEAASARVPREPALESAIAIHRHTVAVTRTPSIGSVALAEAEDLVRDGENDDSRFALRMLRLVVLGPMGPRAEDALRVESGGASFTLPGARTPVPLPVGSPLRLLLDHLATRRLEAPGEGIGLDTLIDVGWPGEKLGVDAGRNRAYVALATLRKKGLRDLLIRGGGGYSLSTAVLVHRGAAEDPD